MNNRTVIVAYDLSPADTESALRAKLIDMGWLPPDETQKLRAHVAELEHAITRAANMLRGMTMDPAIPAHTKAAMRARIDALEALEGQRYA